MLQEQYFGNTVQAWLIAAGIFVIAFVVLLALKRVVSKHLKKLSKQTSTEVDDIIVDVVGHTKYLFVLMVSLYLGSLHLTLSDTARDVLSILVRLAILFQIGVWVSAAATRFIKRPGPEGAKQSSRTAIVFAVKLALWSVVLLVALDNLGVDVTALITGLGIGGVAVALALQNILGDLFASMSITLAEPFVPGDFIVVDSVLGTVEHVGLKTTRLKSLSGEQVVVANTDLLNSRIRNFGRMQERRIVFSIGVTYQTSHAALERIPGLIKEVITTNPGTRFDRSHFQKFGDSALVFETVYYVTSPDYTRYMDIQQEINLEICKKFESEGIEFAYPTQTVYVHPSS